MVEATLSHQQAQQADLLSGAYLGEIEKEQASKTQDLQHLYSIAHSGLVSFLTLLDPDYIEKWIKSGKSLAQLDDRFVQMRVTDLLKSLREKALLSDRGNDGETQKLLIDLENKNRELREALSSSKAANR